jgi:hypothetical protein
VNAHKRLDVEEGFRAARLSEQTVVLGFDHAVALAGASFQFLPVNDFDVTALVADYALILQPVSGDTDSLALDAQHVRDELMRHL